ncbi:hypothetical protein, partial [Mycoplasmopsis bovis]|uniref:hypothetical protein n=1 Tax=Mycoplasmopsis bovis TaxID=28903 RepID=UPI003D2D2A92
QIKSSSALNLTIDIQSWFASQAGATHNLPTEIKLKSWADDDLIWKELWFEVEALLSEAKNAQTFQSFLSFVSSALAIFTNDEFVQRVIAQTKSFD